MRHALNISGQRIAPDWLHAHAVPEWYERYGRRMENYRFPKAETQRSELGATIGRDGLQLLQTIDPATDLPWLRECQSLKSYVKSGQNNTLNSLLRRSAFERRRI